MFLKNLYFLKHFTFPGGLRLPDMRSTKDAAIEAVPAPKIAYVPFSQHTGMAAKPIVAKGSRVKVGARIGEARGFISAHVHSPISGHVVGVRDHPHPKLGSGSTCIIENDGKGEFAEPLKRYYAWAEASGEELLAVITEAGITGQGGGSFPTHVKLSPPAGKPIDTLIVNGCECEPMLTADYRIMVEMTADIIEGARIMQRVLGAARLIIAVEENKPAAAACLEDQIRAAEGTVKLVPTRYPMGSENQLIKTLLGRTVLSGSLPFDVGCIVHNVATALAVMHAVKFGKPLTDRVITVTGDNIREPKNVLVKFGTPVIDVIAFCGGYITQNAKIILGGPMMGVAQYSEEVPVIKGTTAIIVSREASTALEGPCVRCARCVDVCPARLIPCELASFAEHRKFEAARDYSVFDCIECGCCAYVCPTRRKLVHHIRFGKAELARTESAPR